MGRQFATFEHDGRIALPDALTKSLDIKSGTRYEVTVDEEQIHLRPFEQPDLREAFDETEINKLRAMLAGGPPLEDDLLALRREDEAHRRRKEEEWI